MKLLLATFEKVLIANAALSFGLEILDHGPIFSVIKKDGSFVCKQKETERRKPLQQSHCNEATAK